MTNESRSSSVSLNQLAVRQQFPLDFIELVIRQPDRREYRPAVVIAILPDHDIATAQVFEIVGEAAKSTNNRIRVPSGLVFDAFTLDGALTQQIVEVDRKFAIRM